MLDCDIDEQSFNGNLINWKSVTSWDIHNVTIENTDNICNEEGEEVHEKWEENVWLK